MDKSYRIYILGIPKEDTNKLDNFLTANYSNCFAGIYETYEISEEELTATMAKMLYAYKEKEND